LTSDDIIAILCKLQPCLEQCVHWAVAYAQLNTQHVCMLRVNKCLDIHSSA